jgi:hypothetical protein
MSRLIRGSLANMSQAGKVVFICMEQGVIKKNKLIS